MNTPIVSLVIPVYNEAENIQLCLRRLWPVIQNISHEILLCYDFAGDTTLAALAAMPDKPPTVRLVKNDLGAGVAYALRAGFQAARGEVIVTTMADLSDPPEVIETMVRKVLEEGADVVSGSRYMQRGKHLGGPWLKKNLSRLAGWSLYWLIGIATHDPTNNFRAYRASFIQRVPVESLHGFEVGLELTVKAHRLGYKIAEVPSSWRDRSAGKSRFKLWKWLPRYLKWYFLALSTIWKRKPGR